jgi:hypothetical protein
MRTIIKLNAAIFRDIVSCSPYVTLSFRGMCYLHLQIKKSAKLDTRCSRWLGWSSRWHVPPIHRFTYGLHGAISQKMTTFIAVRTSNPRQIIKLPQESWPLCFHFWHLVRLHHHQLFGPFRWKELEPCLRFFSTVFKLFFFLRLVLTEPLGVLRFQISFGTFWEFLSIFSSTPLHLAAAFKNPVLICQ